MQASSHPSFWRRVWSAPEPEISEAGFSGELLIAGIRLLLVLILVFIPAQEFIASSIHDADSRDPRVLHGLVTLALVLAVLVTGIMWSTAGRVGVAGYTVLFWHGVLGAVLAVVVLTHARVRAKRVCPIKCVRSG